MTNRPTFADRFASTFGTRRPQPDMTVVRNLCGELLADVPSAERDAMLGRLEVLRRADDRWHLRSALFSLVSRFHGESVARERLAQLDELLE
jgi:hypothetical protein